MSGNGSASSAALSVDRAREADDGDIVIARINNELTIKRLSIREGSVWLVAESEGYEPIRITEEMVFEVWGKVVFTIHSLE